MKISDVACGYYKIDIGSGRETREGFIGIDKEAYGQNIVRDLEKGLPFCDNSCIEIQAWSIFEHIKDLVFVMNECHRVLKTDGFMYMVVPHWSTAGAYRDPTHCRFFDEGTVEYFEGKKPYHYGFLKWNILEQEHTKGKRETLRWKLAPIK